MNIAELVSNLFLARDVAHIAHLSSRSYAEHMALGDFYPSVIDLADTLTEAYQGEYALVRGITRMPIREIPSVLEFLTDQIELIEEHRYDICDAEDTYLQNIIDEIVQLYRKTIYKLRFLK